MLTLRSSCSYDRYFKFFHLIYAIMIWPTTVLARCKAEASITSGKVKLIRAFYTLVGVDASGRKMGMRHSGTPTTFLKQEKQSTVVLPHQQKSSRHSACRNDSPVNPRSICHPNNFIRYLAR